MLAKVNRASSAEILFVLQKGRLINGFLFSVLVFNLGDSRPPRFAFVISSKICKRAVERNRLKRLLRESLKPLLQRISLGTIVLFLGKKKLVGKESEFISIEVNKVFKKGQLI
ncbi:ribonuclease P protein component [Patescibacteria group bacterium]